MRRLYLFDCRNKDSFSQLIFFFFRNVFNNIFDYHCKILLILSSYVSWFKTEFFQTYKYVNIDECKGFFLALFTRLEELWSHYLGMSHFDDTTLLCALVWFVSFYCFFLLERKSLLTAPLLMLFLCNNVRASVTLKPVEQIS